MAETRTTTIPVQVIETNLTESVTTTPIVVDNKKDKNPFINKLKSNGAIFDNYFLSNIDREIFVVTYTNGSRGVTQVQQVRTFYGLQQDTIMFSKSEGTKLI